MTKRKKAKKAQARKKKQKFPDEPFLYLPVKRHKNAIMKRVILYVHASKESAYQAAEQAGISGELLEKCRYLGTEHKMEYEVDERTGYGKLVAVDDIVLDRSILRK